MDKGGVLLVSDPNPYVRSFLERELGSAGYRVKTAGSGKTIFVCLQEVNPDLLILDLNMPVKIGLGVLARLRKLVPRPPVIVYTDLVEYQQHEQVRWVSAFVEKSGSPIPLKRAVEAVLQKKDSNLNINQSRRRSGSDIL